MDSSAVVLRHATLGIGLTANLCHMQLCSTLPTQTSHITHPHWSDTLDRHTHHRSSGAPMETSRHRWLSFNWSTLRLRKKQKQVQSRVHPHYPCCHSTMWICMCGHTFPIVSVVTVAGICNSVGGGVFFDMPPQCRWRISVGVKASVVNGKQVDVPASRADRSGCPWMC